MVFEALLRHTRQTGSAAAATAVDLTCTAMARGGLYDQLDGLRPVRCRRRVAGPALREDALRQCSARPGHLHWWQVGADPLGLRVVRETLDFLLARMLTPGGLLRPRRWTPTPSGTEGRPTCGRAQLDDVPGAGRGSRSRAVGGRDRRPSTARGLLTLAEDPHDPTTPSGGLWPGPAWRRPELSVCSRNATTRSSPRGTGWRSLPWPRLGWSSGEPRYVAAAASAADFLLAHHLSDAGCVGLHSGGIVGLAWGVAEDLFTATSPGLLTLHQATGDGTLARVAAGGLLDHAPTPQRARRRLLRHRGRGDLFARPRSVTDNAEPWRPVLASPQPWSATWLLAGSTTHLDAGSAAPPPVPVCSRAPACRLAWALAEALATGPVQVVISDRGPDADALWQVAASTHLGGGYLVRGAADAPGVPLLSGRPGCRVRVRHTGVAGRCATSR